MTQKRILLVTIPPFEGGVPAKVSLLSNYLRTLGHDVTVGYYATWGNEPDLVAPSWRLPFGARPRMRSRMEFGGVRTTGIGCWFPEFEISYYLPSKRWTEFLRRFDFHIVVSGNVLNGYRLIRLGLKHFIWCATPFYEERKDRQARMPFWRRLFARIFVVPVLKKMERYVLARSDLVLPISRYTFDRFRAMGRTKPMDILTIPVDGERFSPSTQPAPAGTIGFAGRVNDPRKNISMLIEAVDIVRKKGIPIRLLLTDRPNAGLKKTVRDLGLDDAVEFLGVLNAEALPDFYRRLDVFALPSFQEGLGIVGIEAMATGLPVISTRNGGAEDYVIDGENGFLVGFSAEEMADALMRLIQDRALRDRFGRRAREIALERYNHDIWRKGIESAWRTVWGEAL